MKKIYVVSNYDVLKKDFEKLKEKLGENIHMNVETLQSSKLNEENIFNQRIKEIDNDYDYIIFRIKNKIIVDKIKEYCNFENSKLELIEI